MILSTPTFNLEIGSVAPESGGNSLKRIPYKNFVYKKYCPSLYKISIYNEYFTQNIIFAHQIRSLMKSAVLGPPPRSWLDFPHLDQLLEKDKRTRVKSIKIKRQVFFLYKKSNLIDSYVTRIGFG